MTTKSDLVPAACRTLAAVLVSGLLAPSGLGAAPVPAAAPDTVPLYDDLGDHGYAVMTDVPAVQAYFDQGLRLYYAFNHAEAIRSFREAQRLDPGCAMCWWGEALAWGPNINLPMDSASGAAAWTAVREAAARAEGASPRERALIEALTLRYGADPLADRAARDSAWARALDGLASRYPDDPEIRVLHAEALMDLSPWEYWERDGSPRPGTPELLARLESVLEEDPDHPGANHFYIHALEAVRPERAVEAAERLADLMPGAGHLVHMPGHIYVRVGRWEDAIRANEHAVHADESWIRDQDPEVGVYVAGYYPHNYDFLAFAASMIGRSGQAVGAADRMTEVIPREMLGAPGLAFLQHHLARPLQLRVRFGRWEEILSTSPPREDLLHARAMWRYARGRALAATGDPTGARAELGRLRAAAEHPDLVGLRLEFNTSDAVLSIAAETLAGHVAAAEGDLERAVRRLREAARLEDDLVYGEPPDWTVPVRQELGPVLLAAGRHAEAEAVFREDLERFPGNGWSLHGLARALREQGRDREAAEVEARFREAWSTADVSPSPVAPGP